MLSIGKSKQITQFVGSTTALQSLGRRKTFQRDLGYQPTATYTHLVLVTHNIKGWHVTSANHSNTQSNTKLKN